VRELKAEGLSVGLLGVRAYRPFPAEAIRQALGEAELVIAIDRNCAAGSHGVLYDEVRSALYGTAGSPRVVGVIAGLGGRDVTVRQIKEVARRALKGEPPFDKRDDAIEWLGLDRARVRDESPQARPLARAG
jgi:pyruvate/2-oxoacid:ferredoxin oxidoreductase alpha subunit